MGAKMRTKTQRKLTLKHFNPYSLWAEDKNSSSKFYNGASQYIVDTSTGDKYLNEDRGVIWFKCALLTLGTPFVHTIAAVVLTVINLVKLLSFYHFWKELENNEYGTKDYNFQRRCLDAGTDLLRIILAPISVILLELAAVWGMIAPRDGRKLYASTEQLTYGHFVIAPCFQPEPKEHLFGGDIYAANAF
jgi:hypothetical protein